MIAINELNWDKVDGLIPAIIQDSVSAKVLMLGYMNKEALEQTLSSKQVTFYSRTKQRLWTKGETSGNFLQLVEIKADCDNDTLLILAKPKGNTCHLDTVSCFKDISTDISFLGELQQFLIARKDADPNTSYTAQLFQKGVKRIAQKVGEEGVETALAATVNDNDELKQESADLVYHLLVLLIKQNLNLSDVIEVLKERHNK